MTQPPPPPEPPEPSAEEPTDEPVEAVPPADAADAADAVPAPPPPPAATPPVAVSGTPSAVVAPVAAPVDRIRAAYQRRNETDYIFDFWTALGWTLLTCGIYGFYVVYQLVRRSRDHNARRLEELDAATAFAWEQAGTRGLQDELRPDFERVATHLSAMRQMTTEFRDPMIWTVLAVVASGIVQLIVYILLDSDLVKHDYQQGGAEHELSTIYTRLGAPIPSPDPASLHQAHNYAARVIVLLVSCGFYGLWWLYDVMVELNRHFEKDWVWEDALAASVQSLTI
ncbi:MAG: hypothetical protein ACXW2Y_01010 [Acidimicrobiia bacterium]